MEGKRNMIFLMMTTIYICIGVTRIDKVPINCCGNIV